MTKAELIEKIASDASISKKVAGDALESFMAAVLQSVKKKNGKITLTGFGTFYKHRQKARKCHNPQTGKPMKSKARNVVKFRPGIRLKEFRY